MKKITTILLIVLTSLILTGCDSVNSFMNTPPTTISVMAVSSLEKPLSKVKTNFEKNNNIKLTINYSSSQDITNSIVTGQLADFVILSSQRNMDGLAGQGLIDTGSRVNLVGNTLVAVVSAESEFSSFDQLKSWDVRQIVIGDPESTSSGHYAIDTIEKLGLNSDLDYKLTYEDSNPLVVNTLLENTNYAGILFKSDVFKNRKLKIIYEFPADSYDTIYYPMAITTSTQNLEDCETFKSFLQSETAQNLFADYGFTPQEVQDPSQNQTTEDPGQGKTVQDPSQEQVVEDLNQEPLQDLNQEIAQ